MDAIQQIIELYERGETEAAAMMIDAREELVEVMEQNGFDHAELIDYLIRKNADR